MEPIILCNGHFITFQKKPHRIHALLLDNGLIAKIYSRRERLPQYIQKVDLKGNYVIPGFIDSHTHLIARGIELQRINLESCRSLEHCLEKLHSGLNKENDVVFGSNWDESTWNTPQLKLLNRFTLDRISKRKPVIMRRICGHFAVANTKALYHIPKKWRIVNRKNGYLYEDVVLNLDRIFPVENSVLERAIELGIAEALAKGITSIHEITNPQRFRFLQMVQRKGGLKIRCAAYIQSKHLSDVLPSGMSSGLGNDMLRFAGTKVYLDGSVGARTAAFARCYEKMRTRGTILLPIQGLRTLIKIANDNGIQLMIHAIGDRAVTHALRAFKKQNGTSNELRHRLEHVEKLDSSSIREMAEMNLIASMQPNFVKRWQQPGGLYEQYLAERYKEMNCFRRLLDAGVKVIFGSDSLPPGPLYGIQGALTHPSPCGRLNMIDALRLYTQEPAFATFEEDKKGTLDIGKFADLVVLNKNPLREKNLDTIKTVFVFVGGRIVYRTQC